MKTTSDGVCKESFSTTGRSMQQDASSRGYPDVFVDLRMLEVNEKLADLEKDFFEAAKLRERHLRLLDLELRTFPASWKGKEVIL